MCLAIPGLVERLHSQGGLLWAQVSFSGVKKDVCMQYTPTAQIGDYVLVHVGFALTILSEQEAQLALQNLDASLINDELTWEGIT